MASPSPIPLVSTNEQLKEIVRQHSGLHLVYMDEVLSNHRTLNIDKLEGPDSSNKFAITWPITFQAELGNVHSTLHGGVAAYLVDAITSTHLFLLDGRRAHVSVNLSLTYMKPVPLGTEVLVKTYISSVGKNLAFLEAEFWSLDGKTLLITATHSKMFKKQSGSKL